MKEGETILYENENGMLFDSAKESIINQLSQIAQLENEGNCTLCTLKDELEDKLRIIIEEQDKARLAKVRQELKSVVNED